MQIWGIVVECQNVGIQANRLLPKTSVQMLYTIYWGEFIQLSKNEGSGSKVQIIVLTRLIEYA